MHKLETARDRALRIVPADRIALSQVATVMAEGRPWLPESSDYWLLLRFFGSTSFVALHGETAVGGLIACRNPNQPGEIYVDQVAVHRSFRGQGIVQALFHSLEALARELRCHRIWLSSDPRNPAVRVWPRLGYVNCPGDATEGDLQIRRDFKGPGKHRAVFEKIL